MPAPVLVLLVLAVVVAAARRGGAVPDLLPSDRLGQFWTLPELSATSTGIPNTPPAWAAANLGRLVAVVLDPWRSARGAPLIATSGFRSEAVNAAVGGADGSQHTLGEAADVVASGLSSEQLAREFLDLGIPFDQVVWYDSKPHVHVSWTDRRAARGVVLRSPSPGTYVSQDPGVVA